MRPKRITVAISFNSDTLLAEQRGFFDHFPTKTLIPYRDYERLVKVAIFVRFFLNVGVKPAT